MSCQFYFFMGISIYFLSVGFLSFKNYEYMEVWVYSAYIGFFWPIALPSLFIMESVKKIKIMSNNSLKRNKI